TDFREPGDGVLGGGTVPHADRTDPLGEAVTGGPTVLGAADAAAPGGRVGEQITTGPAVADGLAVANGLALGVLDGAVLRSGAVGVEPTSADGVPDGVGCILAAAGDPTSASRVAAVNVKYRLGVVLVITHRPRGGANRRRRVDREETGSIAPFLAS